MFRCTVDSTSRVSLASGNRANVNDMAGVSGLEIYTRGISRFQRFSLSYACRLHTVDDKLGDSNQTEHVHVEHRLKICFCDVAYLLYTEHETGIVHYKAIESINLVRQDTVLTGSAYRGYQSSSDPQGCVRGT